MRVALILAAVGLATAGQAAARPASYTEKPPARFQTSVSANVRVMPTWEAVDEACRRLGIPIPDGRVFVECVITTPQGSTVLMPPIWTGSGGWVGDALRHAFGHAAGWSMEHER